MRNCYKNILLAVLLSMAGATIWASNPYSNYFGYSNEDYTASVSYDDSSPYHRYSGDLVIPETVEYNGNTYTVTGIGVHAFKDCKDLKSITIPNTVIHIDAYAFGGNLGLESINMSENIRSVHDDFKYGLRNTPWWNKQPDGVVYIGNICLDYKGQLNEKTCLEIKDGTQYIVPEAFQNYTEIVSVNISNTVKYIGNHAFWGCSGLTFVTIPNSVETIGRSAFGRCTGLTSVTIGNSVTSIKDCAFFGCNGLTSITIPNSVTSIGEGAFYNCSSLSSVTIPNSVTYEGGEVFTNTPWLENQPDGPFYIGACFSGWIGTMPEKTFLDIADGTVTISDGACTSCFNLSSVTIPNSVTSIGRGAFCNCTGLTSITIPNSCKTIGGGAFQDCI